MGTHVTPFLQSRSYVIEEAWPGETAQVATWMMLPHQVAAPVASPWVFAIPGASYRGRAYFDYQSEPGYSMAQYLSIQGIGVVMIDNLGTGDSSCSTPGAALRREHLADVYTQVADQIRMQLAEGSLPDLAPIREQFWVGVGHSMGGYILSALQGLHSPFQGCAFLGWAQGPWDEALLQASSRLLNALEEQDGFYTVRDHASLRPFFYGDPSTCSEAIMQADEAARTTIPKGVFDAMLEQPTAERAKYARSITGPVFVGSALHGDVALDPRDEGRWYGTKDFTYFLQERASHCANFSPDREVLWQRLASWIWTSMQVSGAGKCKSDRC